MTDTSLKRWADKLLFVLAVCFAIGLSIMPMGLAANAVAFPDVVFAVMVAWVIRKPASAPVILVVLLGILADALMMRPIGLWALMLLAGTEGIRLSYRMFRDIPFVLEWVYVSVLLIALLILQNLILLVSFADVYQFTDVFWHAIRTIAVYPVVVAILHWALRIRATSKNKRPNRLGYVL